MSGVSLNTLVSALGFLVGLAFGAVAQRTNFCTMGGVSDMIVLGDLRRFRAWLLAIAVAMLGSEALHVAGVIDLGKSIYLTPNFGWLGAIVGGLMFGFGMTLAGGCGSRTLVRFGAGNLKSLIVVMVLAISAYMTLRGLIGLVRVAIIEPTNVDLKRLGLNSQGIPEFVAALAGMTSNAARATVAMVAVATLLWFCFKDADFRHSRKDVVAGVLIGALIPSGWFVTGVIGADDFEPTPLASLTFVAPVGDAVVYLMLFTGTKINFGIAAVGGVIAGACVAALGSRTFRIESFSDARDMLRHLAGGALMGVGGVLALGCTIGQGITGLSTLALGSIIAFASIIAGSVCALKYLAEGSLGGALRALGSRG
jgi:uncharacterized membrane protein YedE/YeeE